MYMHIYVYNVLTHAEEPKYTEEDEIHIAETKKPLPVPDDLRELLATHLSETVILLHTVKEEEMLAALNHLNSPVEQRGSNKPIRWFEDKISLILGIFGGHKAALIQTSKGVDCQHEILPALRRLRNIKLIIGLGFAYGLRSKCDLGDVLVSTYVDGVGNCRIVNNTLKFDEGRVRHTSMSTAALNVFTKHTCFWRSFTCTKAGRLAKVVTGPLISSPMLLDDQNALDEFLKNNERFKGGEMEGQELARAQLSLKDSDGRDVDFIVIKGVADFGDGTKEKGWQLTASLAAANYAEHKLLDSGGKVYYC